MLRELRIRNLAVIETADLSLPGGFVAVTGETGAGKSIFLGALQCLMGSRIRPDLIRAGADRLKVEGVFEFPGGHEAERWLADHDFEAEGEVSLEREVSRAGKSRCRINGMGATLGDLEALTALLLDLHGQHEQQSLLSPASHLEFLDGYARLGERRSAYADAYAEFRRADATLAKLREETGRLREQGEFLRFQHQELEKADVKPGEDEAIEAEIRKAAGQEKIERAVAAAREALERDPGGALGSLQAAARNIASLHKWLDPNPLEDAREKLEAAATLASEAAAGLSAFTPEGTSDAADLDRLNARLALIQKLCAKYRTDIGGLLELRHRRAEEILALDEDDDRESAALRARDAARERASRLAAELTTARTRAAAAFDGEVHKRLQDLAMAGSRFVTHLRPRTEKEGDLGPAGADHVEFHLAANPGEPERPLRLSASGGEISRVMLAVKTALAAGDTRPLLVFDELDAGIGGETGQKVGEALRDLSRHHQLLVITHLHQVAARAAHQIRVEKSTEGGRTSTRLERLEGPARVAELARMLGDSESATARKHAKQLLAQAQEG